MSINVNDKNLGHATAYAYYKAGGGTMTEAEFTEFMADFGTASQTAVEAAQAALASKNAAQTAATTATNKATEATTAATTATTKAGEASTSASTATSAKDTAVSASQTATTKATEATTAAATATSAKTDAVAANTAAQSAKTAAQTAQTGAETAAASVSASAAQIATNTSDINELKEDLTQKADQTDMLKAFPTDTASGSVASFADGANVPVKSLIVNIDPVQSGSGYPSPTNVRPISGWSEVNVSHSGADMTNPTVISIQLGQTVYGGTLDVVSGELSVDNICINPSEFTISRMSGNGTITTVLISGITQGKALTAISNRFSEYIPSDTAGRMAQLATEIYVILLTADLSSDTNEGVRAWFSNNPTQICYELATPLTIQLTPHEVRSLLGSNNVWADTGDSTVEYRADPTLYIGRLTEPDADMVADANITSGQYFMVGNTLYKATANIASGATISPNVNCTRKSLSEALNELNA